MTILHTRDTLDTAVGRVDRAQPAMTLRYEREGPFIITGDQLDIKATTPAPVIQGQSLPQPQFTTLGAAPGALAGLAGTLITQTAQLDSILLLRKWFQSDDGQVLGLRLKLSNTGPEPLTLHSLPLLQADGPKSVLVGGLSLEDWQILRMSRHKNDVPGMFRLGDQAPHDVDLKHARIDGAEFRAGMGVPSSAALAGGSLPGASHVVVCANLHPRKHTTIVAEPCICISPRKPRNPRKPQNSQNAQQAQRSSLPSTGTRNILFLGMLGQTEHLSRIILRASDEPVQLDRLSVEAEFDDVILPPGQSRHTHWLIVTTGTHEQALLESFADMLAAEMGLETGDQNAKCEVRSTKSEYEVRSTKCEVRSQKSSVTRNPTFEIRHPKFPPPTIFCSWYFYGRDFTQADLHENMATLRDKPIPFDAFVIDNGWMDNFGEWNHHAERFSQGMPAAAEAIRAAGRVPGIWTCPFVLSPESEVVRRHPRLVLRDADGKPCTFPYKEPEYAVDMYVLDTTAPEAEAYLREVYRRLESWDFHYHKLDFLRSIIVPLRPRFHDRTATRAQAYRRGLAIIRDAIGPDSYLLVCGGLFEGSAGLADGVRVGSDVKGRWYEPDGSISYLTRIKQNVFRSYTNRLWHTDPDALQIRRRCGPFRGQSGYAHLSDGSLNDDEAFTCVVNQYIGGGLVCLTERVAELSDDRRRLFRHVIPPITPPAKILDIDRPTCPTLFLTQVTPRWADLAPWWTLAVCNWEDTAVMREVELPALDTHEPLAVFELATQQWLGVHRCGQALRIEVPAHGTRVLRLAPWNGQSPILVGTDRHLTGGAAEIEQLDLDGQTVRGRIASLVQGPIRLTFAHPAAAGTAVETRSITLDGPGPFALPWPDAERCMIR
ncbi:MAG: glycoside hydrolase family 36 protein [Phycisphaeraceae bacterium]